MSPNLVPHSGSRIREHAQGHRIGGGHTTLLCAGLEAIGVPSPSQARVSDASSPFRAPTASLSRPGRG